MSSDNSSSSKILLACGAALLFASSIAIGLLLSEAGYRVFLFSQHPERFIQGQKTNAGPPVWFFEKSPWLFSEPFGYEYAKETVYGGSANGGKVQSCWNFPLNAQGNVGRIEGDYASADLKILVFGDSFTAQPHDELTWPHYLQRRLNERGRPTANVVNFARDGYGILQMFDLAAVKVSEFKPDLVIFAFITDDLTRARTWRAPAMIEGRERILTTDEPNPNPDPHRASDTAVRNSKATPEWCRDMVASQRTGDPILAEMESVVLDAKAQSQSLASLYASRQSFLYNLLARDNPFYSVYAGAKPTQNPRHTMADFAMDARFMAAVAKIKETGIPIVLIHLATVDEMKQGKEFVGGANETSLFQNLATTVGVPIMETLVYAPPVPADELGRIANSASDTHPSSRGLMFYAAAATAALERNDLLEPPAKGK